MTDDLCTDTPLCQRPDLAPLRRGTWWATHTNYNQYCPETEGEKRT
jgi:hypothetical protein